MESRIFTELVQGLTAELGNVTGSSSVTRVSLKKYTSISL